MCCTAYCHPSRASVRTPFKIKPLLERVAKGGVKEVIVATNPSMEGDATALYLQQQLRSSGVHVTRLARGCRWAAIWSMPTRVRCSGRYRGGRRWISRATGNGRSFHRPDWRKDITGLWSKEVTKLPPQEGIELPEAVGVKGHRKHDADEDGRGREADEQQTAQELAGRMGHQPSVKLPEADHAQDEEEGESRACSARRPRRR